VCELGKEKGKKERGIETMAQTITENGKRQSSNERAVSA